MAKPKPDKPNRPSGNRGAGGRFAPGNPGSPGRAPRSVEDHYLATLRAEVTPEDWAEICKRAVKDAKQDKDTPARTAAVKWLSKYLLPEPSHNVNIGGTLADLLASMAGQSDTTLAD